MKYLLKCSNDYFSNLVTSNCGGIYKSYAENSMTGRITSPGFPARYDTDMDCTYNITLPTKMDVMVTFRVFDLEDASSCGYDYLKVRTVYTVPVNVMAPSHHSTCNDLVAI